MEKENITIDPRSSFTPSSSADIPVPPDGLNDECGVLTQVGNDYVIARKPDHDDGFACTTASMSEQNKVFEQAFSR